MTELQSILEACKAAEQRGTDGLLATVVHVEGSTYRRPGARKFMTADGHSIGLISGGCLENAVRRKAFWHTAEHGATVVRYDTSSGDDVALEFGLGCQGIVDVLLERIPQAKLSPALEHVHQALAEKKSTILATVVGSSDGRFPVGTREAFAWELDFPQRLQHHPWLALSMADELAQTARDGRSRTLTSGSLVIFVECITPPTHLLIVGAGLDVPAVVKLAAVLGWDITVVDPRAAYVAPSRFPEATRVLACTPDQITQHVKLDGQNIAVLMTHNVSDDLSALRTLLPAKLAYVGVLGPRVRTDRLLEELQRNGYSPSDDEFKRLHAPIGLDLGADSPEEIALAIVSEISAILRGHPAGFLKDRAGPIHRPPLSESPIPPATRTESVSCPI